MDDVIGFVDALGKTPVRTSDKTGFIVNRLLVPYILDAVRALEEGVGSISDIDEAMKLGCGYPMGPFTLLDLVGLDTTYYIANVFFEEFRERRFASPPLLKRMVMAGLLGKKSGKGFYDYSGPKPVAEIDSAFVAAAADPEVGAVILTGSGPKAFVAGADIGELARQTPLAGKE